MSALLFFERFLHCLQLTLQILDFVGFLRLQRQRREAKGESQPGFENN